MKVIEIDKKRYKCPKCNVRFTHHKNIARHIRNNHLKSNQKYQCILCKKLYAIMSNYDQHFDKTYMFENVLYTNPEKVEGNSKRNTLYIFQLNYVLQ